MPVMAVSKFERFFRAAAELGIDRSDIQRPSIGVTYSVETEARFPEIVGGLAMALARTEVFQVLL